MSEEKIIATPAEPQNGVARDSFWPALTSKLLADCYRAEQDNFDFVRFPVDKKRKITHWVKERIFSLAGRYHWTYASGFVKGRAAKELDVLIDRAEDFAGIYETLADESSRRRLIELLAYRVLGRHRVKLSSNNIGYWEALEIVNKKLLKTRHTYPIDSLDGFLHYFELDEIGFPVRLHAHALNILNTFLLRQYEYQSPHGAISAVPGEVVIDAGAGWGDTALYFAHLVGPTGRVYGLEFVPGNLAIFGQNLALNEPLKEIIEVVPYALWDKSGESLSFRNDGTSSALLNGEQTTITAETLALDDFVERCGLPKVDLIKMDIEGAELNGLRGAKQTIRTFRPKLAIAAYHKSDDLFLLPRYLGELGLEYKFFLGHFTIHQEETVMFALPPRKSHG